MRYVFKKKWLILSISILDTVGYLLSAIIKIFKKKNVRGKPEKILIIRLDHIGDVVLANCVFKPLKNYYPEARISFLGGDPASDIIEGNPYVDEVVRFNAPWFERGQERTSSWIKGFFALIALLKKGGYDTVIDLRGDIRHITAMSIAGIKNRISYGITGGGFLLTCNVRYDRLQHEALKDLKLLSAIGIKEKKANIEIFYDKEELASADLVKRSAGLVGPYAVIHAVAGQDEKMWSIDNFFEVTRYVRDIKKLLPVFIGSAKDKIFIHEIIGLLAGGAVDLSGSTGLKITAKLIADATLFIGLDSGPAHIASATDTPSIVLFSGINSLDQWAPAGENIDIISPGENRNLSEVTSEEVCRAIDKRIGIKIAGKDKI